MHKFLNRGAIALACALVLPLLGTLPARAHATDDAFLSVVHGLPGRDVAPTLNPLLPVDVLVNDQICLLKGLIFGRVAGPFALPAGTYGVKVSLANTISPCSNPPVISASATLKAGENASLVAALSPKGAPILYPFALDLSSVPTGENRVITVHAADAPSVSFVFNQQLTAVKNVTPGTAKSIILGAHGYSLTLVPTAGSQVVLGPQALKLSPRGVTVIYAVGSLASGSLQFITSTFPNAF